MSGRGAAGSRCVLGAGLRGALFVLLAALVWALSACDGVPLGSAPGGDGPAPSCTNHVQDGNETDTDCGGSCPKCTAALGCQTGADCTSGICTDALCAGEATQPEIVAFTADRSQATVGFPVTLTAIFSGGVGSIDNGIGPVQNGAVVVTPPLSASTTFTLTVTSKEMLTTSRTVDVAAIAAPMITSFVSDQPAVLAGQATLLTAVFSGGIGTVSHGVGPITSGVPVTTGAVTTDTEYVLSVANSLGDAVTAKLSVAAAVTPVITSFTAPGAAVSRFVPTKLSAIFTGGAGTVDQGIGAVTSGLAIDTGKVNGPTTFTLTVTNALNQTATKTLSVTTKKELFVNNYDGYLLAFDVDASGDVTPKRTITVGKAIGDMGVLVSNDEIYVATEKGEGIDVYNVTDEDDAAGNPPMPKRKIINTPGAGAYMFSLSGTELYVADRSSTISVWNTTDSGMAAPKRTLSGAATLLDNTLATYVDSGELYASNYANAGTGSISVYPAAATGNTAPTRSWPIQTPTGILVSGSELIVSNKDPNVGITVFDKTTGAKLRSIVGPTTQMADLYQCVVETGELYCGSFGNDRVLVYPVTGNGDIAPSRVLAGPVTSINGPSCITIY